MKIEDRIKGCLYGIAVGDALGALYGYEAIPKRWVNVLQYKDELELSYDMIMKFRNK